ncbi:MAG: hypothetical protein QM286_02145, partial [Acidobacteriota bacterium]|nr:hypothetical protein [Acidobacteriota bacterium]
EETVPFAELASADLVPDRAYAGGTRGNAGDECPNSRWERHPEVSGHSSVDYVSVFLLVV